MRESHARTSSDDSPAHPDRPASRTAWQRTAVVKPSRMIALSSAMPAEEYFIKLLAMKEAAAFCPSQDLGNPFTVFTRSTTSKRTFGRRPEKNLLTDSAMTTLSRGHTRAMSSLLSVNSSGADIIEHRRESRAERQKGTGRGVKGGRRRRREGWTM
eukprot:1263551-Rhodomonas_salina.1